MIGSTLRTEIVDRVHVITLTRAREHNTITPALRDELARAIDEGDESREARVILLRAEGPAFCAGYGLDWATAAQAEERALADQGTAERRTATGPSATASSSLASNERAPTVAGPSVAEPGAPIQAVAPIGSAGPGEAGLEIEGAAAAGRDAAPWREAPRAGRRIWDSVADLRVMSRFVDTYMKLWYARKPTIAAVQGWCIGGGTDMVLCADMVVAGKGARFGYPPSRVWGTPTTAMWVYRMGLERAKRWLLTGDEIPAPTAAEIGLILECVPDDRLEAHSLALARRMAQVPTSQLVMLKLLCNQTAENMGLASSRLLGTLFDGVARHTQEGLDFVARAQQVGFRQAVRERDDPFGDYGSRAKPKP